MDSAKLVVGIPVYGDSEPPELEGKYCRCFGYRHKNCITFHTAGYEHYSKGQPNRIIGICLIEPWNDAHEISFREILEAAKKIKDELGKTPKTFIIGHQT